MASRSNLPLSLELTKPPVLGHPGVVFPRQPTAMGVLTPNKEGKGICEIEAGCWGQWSLGAGGGAVLRA